MSLLIIDCIKCNNNKVNYASDKIRVITKRQFKKKPKNSWNKTC